MTIHIRPVMTNFDKRCGIQVRIIGAKRIYAAGIVWRFSTLLARLNNTSRGAPCFQIRIGPFAVGWTSKQYLADIYLQ